ncbi:MAG: hypothetical protein ABL879_14220 [Devosia sp.]
MKVTLDLTELVSRGALTAAEAEKLKGLADTQSSTLGINIILSFGVVAIVAAAGVLFPHPLTAIGFGAALMIGGFLGIFSPTDTWRLLARTCLTIGALLFWGGVAFYAGTSPLSVGLMSLGISAVAVVARSGLLSGLAVLGLGGAASTGLGESEWWIFSPRPTVTIVVFGVLSLALLFASTRLPAVYERLAIIAARTSVLVVCLALIFASVFGDGSINREFFAIAFALLLIACVVWAVRVDRRWVINTAAIFGAIHFFIQWFMYLGANPFSVLLGGILLIAFGLGLRSVNQRFRNAAPA